MNQRGLVGLKETRMGNNIMNNENTYDQLGLNQQQVFASRTGNLARVNNAAGEDDIEVIDLDDPRGQIKPTTWHR
ncbi:MAG: hypothetical protein ACYS17_13765 [Planctomycetota bacterium]